MSRIGKKPITIESDITLTISDGLIQVGGPKGQLELNLPPGVRVKRDDSKLEVKVEEETASNLQGLFHRLLENAFTGVKKGWAKTLELSGVGFRAEIVGNTLKLFLGFSQPKEIVAPKGVTFEVMENEIKVSGVDKYLVGETAARIKRLRPAEPYKGKGIRYQGEQIRRKVGKTAKAVGAIGAKP